jgi:hypothetical protein
MIEMLRVELNWITKGVLYFEYYVFDCQTFLFPSNLCGYGREPTWLSSLSSQLHPLSLD